MAKKKHVCPEPENTERWAVSYLDMITVLMCLFLVLYAISQVDQGKLAKLRQSLAAGFNSTIQVVNPIQTTGGLGILTGSTSAVSIGSLLGNQTDQAATQPERLEAMKEASHLNEIKKKVEKQLQTVGQQGALQMRITENGLVLGMVANDTYFQTGDASVQPAAQAVISALAPVIQGVQEDVAIEGYADPQPIATAKFPSNYHLASARAIEVLIHLKNGGVPGEKLRTISYGSDHQTTAEEGQDAWGLNRRVDIVIMSKAKDSVRAMLPDAAKQLENGPVETTTGSEVATVQ
ncbi:MAG: OmpA family protein [Mobiluncus sp.]|uniref:flagellar motor protein MotB n=1 Tax=Mobiluncus sp. TaxID=47293 RepID=UPI002584A4B8|nr:flagellar motor protein MotB [Mobiluncus sp.]MCI6584710.1 OmpA family protein [Mobiluncus sp.]